MCVKVDKVSFRNPPLNFVMKMFFREPSSFDITEAAIHRCFVKKGVFKNLKRLLIKIPATFCYVIKKRLRYRCFEFSEFFKTAF